MANNSIKITRVGDDELTHFGVIGMRWGHRKVGPVGRAVGNAVAKEHQVIGKIQRKAANAARKDEQSIRSQKSQMLALTKNGKSLFTEKQVDDIANNYHERAKKLDSKATNHERLSKQLSSSKQIKEKQKAQGKTQVEKLLKKNGTVEEWKLSSKEEQDLFNELKNSGGFDEYLDE